MAEVRTAIYDEFAEFITSEPTLEQIVEFDISEAAQARYNALSAANRSRRLMDFEEVELNEFIQLEQVVRRIKMLALQKLEEREGSEENEESPEGEESEDLLL